jgi:hypothetical protein
MLNWRGKLAVAAATLLLSAQAVSAQAANLVINGGFETGDFSGWTLTGNTADSNVSTDLPSFGQYAADFGASGTLGGVTQTLNTVPGGAYTVWFDLQSLGGEPTRALVTFGNQTLLDLTDPASFAYTSYNFNVTATSAQTALTFQFRNDSSLYRLDNVLVLGAPVSAVPEPATWAMLMLGMFGVGAMMRLRRRPAAA